MQWRKALCVLNMPFRPGIDRPVCDADGSTAHSESMSIMKHVYFISGVNSSCDILFTVDNL